MTGHVFWFIAVFVGVIVIATYILRASMSEALAGAGYMARTSGALAAPERFDELPNTAKPKALRSGLAPRVVAVAVRKDMLVLSLRAPFRHYHLLRSLDELLGVDPAPFEQGFLSSEGLFLTREQAADVAYRAGQIARVKLGDLFSEDLW